MSDDWRTMVNKFENYRQEVREGKKGKTAQFWIMYLDLMRLEHQIHTVIQTNDFNIRLNAKRRSKRRKFQNEVYFYCRWYTILCQQ